MIPSLFVVVFRVSQLAFNLFVPLLLLEETKPGLVLLTNVFSESVLRFALGSGRLFLKMTDPLQFLDRAFDCLCFGLAFRLEDLGQTLCVLLFCRQLEGKDRSQTHRGKSSQRSIVQDPLAEFGPSMNVTIVNTHNH